MPLKGDEPVYALESHSPAVDDPNWTICHFHDRGAAGPGGLTITVSDAMLERLTSGDLARPLTSAEIMGLDGR